MAGKIFTKDEANKLYGPVLESVTMDIKEFNSHLSKTGKDIMFKLDAGKLIILGDGRSVIHPAGTVISKDTVFALASKSVVLELVNNGSDSQIYVENRKSTTTVTYGANTLEEVWLCPPICVSN